MNNLYIWGILVLSSSFLKWNAYLDNFRIFNNFCITFTLNRYPYRYIAIFTLHHEIDTLIFQKKNTRQFLDQFILQLATFQVSK